LGYVEEEEDGADEEGEEAVDEEEVLWEAVLVSHLLKSLSDADFLR
jgi:hypothetical protein